MDAIANLLLRLNTHSGRAVDRDGAYTRSYRAIRLAVGALGVLLPVIFILGEAIFLTSGFHFRGSLSAYYHSPMQDIFVGGLCVVGVLLATYLSGEPRSLDFVVSLVAGVAVLGVVFLPTTRPELAQGAPPCESGPAIPGCSFVERALGESNTGVVHGVCAFVFIIGLAVMSLLFAAAEVVDRRSSGRPRPGRRRVFALHVGCAAVILLAVAWAVVGGALGLDLGELTPLYVGEVAAVWAFGASWFVAGRDVTAPPRRPETSARDGAGPIEPAPSPTS